MLAVTAPIAGTDDDTLYQSQRWGMFSYDLPLANGKYDLTLNLNEQYWTAANQRKFSVDVEGVNLVKDLDLIATTGANRAVDLRFANIIVNDGYLNIRFYASVNEGTVSGIVVKTAGQIIGSSSSSSSSSNSSSSSSGLSAIENGKAIFASKCASCHAATAREMVEKTDGTNHDLPSLTQIIVATMPIARPADCVGECADATARYIASVNPFYGKINAGLRAPFDDIDPAPVTMTRLNRAEYNNTVRDLFGTSLQPANEFPPDNFGRFNNDASVLSLSPLHIEAYNTASIKLANEAVESARIGNRKVITCDLTAATCVDTVIQDLGSRAWRRAITTEEAVQLKSLYNSAQTTLNDRYGSMAALVRAMILSPNFIFRPEIDANLTSSNARALNGYELASRLSYFLWSSMPDATLFAKARTGGLSTDAAIKEEVTRMLNDPKSIALIDNFAAQWLTFREFADPDRAQPDAKLFPSFNSTLKSAMINESRTFLKYLLDNNKPLAEIVTADYTFLNDTLATHYGITGITGSEMRLHQWDANAKRRGLLGQSSLLTTLAHPDHTSPVKRGIWVMDRLMCDRPAEPPPEAVAMFPTLPEGLNPRKFSELHRDSSTICYSCHAYVDPIGYGLENFDPIGKWRNTYPNGDVVDAVSALPTGEGFSNLIGLSAVLSTKQDVAYCSIQHAMTYALGRMLNTFEEKPGPTSEPSDYAAVYSVFKKTEVTGHRFRDVITEIVLSPTFRNRRGADSL